MSCQNRVREPSPTSIVNLVIPALPNMFSKTHPIRPINSFRTSSACQTAIFFIHDLMLESLSPHNISPKPLSQQGLVERPPSRGETTWTVGGSLATPKFCNQCKTTAFCARTPALATLIFQTHQCFTVSTF